MKFRPFQTLLVVATIVTCGAPLQAFYVTNNTDVQILVHRGSPRFSETVDAGAIEKDVGNPDISGKFTIDVCVGECTKNLSCTMSHDGLLTVNPSGTNGMSIICND